VTINVIRPEAQNPFTDITVSGRFRQNGQANDLVVDGFCDDPDGTVFRVRFMPSNAGNCTYSVTYRYGNFESVHNGRFEAIAGKHHGVLRVDPNYPWHFIWEGSGEHCFLNGATAFLLLGWIAIK